MKITDALNEIISNLEAAGLAATDNPARLQYPGALILPGNIEFRTLSADIKDVDFQVYLVAANKPGVALDHLETALDKFRTVYPITEAKPVSLPLTAGEPFPALSITLSLRLTKD